MTPEENEIHTNAGRRSGSRRGGEDYSETIALLPSTQATGHRANCGLFGQFNLDNYQNIGHITHLITPGIPRGSSWQPFFFLERHPMFSRLRRARRPQSPATLHSLQSLESRLVLAFAIAEPQLLVTGSPDGSVVTGTDGKDVSGPEVTITGNPVLVMPTGDPEAVAYTTAVLTSVPAGTVTASVSRSGDISITGDADSNSVTVDIGGGYVTLSSPTGTRFRLAGQPAVNGPLAFALPAAVRSLSID
ncbi:MAG: hypothetical protein RLZZ458_2117, partial [Planctomycetota bacterium]